MLGQRQMINWCSYDVVPLTQILHLTTIYPCGAPIPQHWSTNSRARLSLHGDEGPFKNAKSVTGDVVASGIELMNERGQRQIVKTGRRLATHKMLNTLTMQILEFKGIRDPEILTKIGAKLKTDRRRGILEKFEFQVTKDNIDVFLLDVFESNWPERDASRERHVICLERAITNHRNQENKDRSTIHQSTHSSHLLRGVCPMTSCPSRPLTWRKLA